LVQEIQRIGMRNGKNGSVKTALVAGGAGFLGSHLCDSLLARGFHVLCLDNFLTGRRENLTHLEREPRFDLIEADVVNPLPARLRGSRLDQIWNLACPASPPAYQADPEHTLLTSVMGTHHLLRLAEATGARFFLASTSEVYGDPEVHPQKESYWGHVNPTGPRACYDEGKRAAETLAFDYDRGGRADVRVVRIFNTYGPRLPAEDGRVVSNVINQALLGEDMTVYGDGRQTRAFCYVDDLIDGLQRLMDYEGPQPGPVNLGNPTELTVNELVERVIALTGSKSRVVHRPLPKDDPQRRRPDISRAAELLGWTPKTSVDAGLRATIAWYKAELEQQRPAATFEPARIASA
jgi:UDP-glucuronate decarboxylase